MLAPDPAAAQYFGRNKVQYDHMDFLVLETPHFDVHFYPVMEEAIQDVARMAERWYERLARLFQLDLEQRKPLIFYADHPDFQQSNTREGFISAGTGGVTGALEDRVIMPLGGSYAATDRVLGHELVHAFQFDVARSWGGEGVSGLIRMPMWQVEGMAQYLSAGREDTHTAMWLRDALLHDAFPAVGQMTGQSRFFPYRFGQALWAYIGGMYGDETVVTIFRRSLRMDLDYVVFEVLGTSMDALSAAWRRQVEAAYLPLMEGRQDPEEAGALLLAPSTGSGTLNLAPVLSPDGRTVAYLSEKDLFSIDLVLADARTGRVIRTLSNAASDPHIDALAWTGTSGTFSPEGTSFAFVVYAGGSHELVVARTADGGVERRLRTPDIGAIEGPTWSPDGGRIAFTGTVGGQSDLFVYDLATDEVRQLTRDRHADLHPSWSPDGSRLAFATDRGPETNFGRLVYGEFQLALLDVATGQLQVLDVFGNVRHSNPHFAPDGESLYFLSDQDGFSDVYRLWLASGETERITRLKTGVSGVTGTSPALSVAARTGELAFTVFSGSEFHVYTRESNPEGGPVVRVADAAEQPGRRIPPARPGRRSRVADYLGNPDLGLQPALALPVSSATPYRAALSLDHLGRPNLSVNADRWGHHLSGAASAFFSDMLGNRHLGVAAQPARHVRDVQAEFIYGDQARRWNWGVGGGHTPWQIRHQQFQAAGGKFFLQTMRLRILETRLRGHIALPLSTTRRVELGAGVGRMGFDLWEHRYYMDSSGQVYSGVEERLDHDARCSQLSEPELETTPCRPDPLNMALLSASWVGDNSTFGFTSPIRGERFRLGLEATLGTETFVTAVADWRRYYSPVQNLTVAVRGLHMGRYGGIDNTDAIQPWFLGFEAFVRGYSMDSFRAGDCQPSAEQRREWETRGTGGLESACGSFARLLGQRLAVVNLEVRLPLLGFEQFGLIHFPYLPTELVAFADAGLAWDWNNPPVLEFSRSDTERVPVFSAGVAARFNVAGFLMVQAYHAFPFQRPLRGPHWGFVMTPGW